jgi:hypothetical protein
MAATELVHWAGTAWSRPYRVCVLAGAAAACARQASVT